MDLKGGTTIDFVRKSIWPTSQRVQKCFQNPYHINRSVVTLDKETVLTRMHDMWLTKPDNPASSNRIVKCKCKLKHNQCCS